MNRYISICSWSWCGIPLLIFFSGSERTNPVYYRFYSSISFSLQRSHPDSIKTEKQYFAALHAADATTFKNEFETEFLLLLDKQQTQEYDSLASLEMRKAFIENYWKASNPNPLLPENDWLLDFLKRRTYARERFPDQKPPYFDDRGKYYLKYGKPRFRFNDAGAPDIYSNESWSYENVTPNFLVHFVRDGLTFRETDNVLSFYEGGKFRSPEFYPEQWSRIVTRRATVSPVFARAAVRIQEPSLKSNTALAIEFRQSQTELHAIYHQATVEVLKAKRECPPAAHDEINAVNKLKFFETLAQFRAPDGNTRLEVALLSPVEKNIVKNILRAATDTLRLTYSCLVSDQQFKRVAIDETTTRIPLQTAVREKFLHAVGSLTVAVSPQGGDLTLQIKDESSDKVGFSRQPLTIRDFRGRALMLSDIQFLMEVTNPAQRQILPVATKLNTFVAPYPFEKIRKKNPLFCYFEIYNLKSSGIKDNYEVVYKIVSEKETAVSVSYTRLVIDDSAPELIAIDLSKVPKGEHRLEITVTARNDRNITASVQKEIRIDD